MPEKPPMPGTGGGGFRVDPKQLLAQAAALTDSASDLFALNRSLRTLGGGSAVFGEAGAPEAFANFSRRIVDELATQYDALEELAGKLRVSAGNYEFLDEFGAAGIAGALAIIGAAPTAAQPQGSGVLGRVGQILDDVTSLPAGRPG